MSDLAASFSPDASVTAAGSRGQLAHHSSVAHTDRLAPAFETIGDGVWCVVGNGLSNQVFVRAPEGLIAIDSGESNEEMGAALAMLRDVTDEPIVAMICTHSHYIAGTDAILAERRAAGLEAELPIWGHERIPVNRRETGLELAPAGGRGLVHQFGMMLPADGPDGLENCGLGLHYRNPAHGRPTVGFRNPTHPIDAPTAATIAGLDVELTPAPSDVDDSITIWFPSLRVCVNNIAWPALFNVFAIRGERFRDPSVLLDGLDHIVDLGPEHLVCCHGPSMSGGDEIAAVLTRYRDSIQYLLDQTVRGINRGLTLDELTRFVQLPDEYAEHYTTEQLYGVVEHHVKQIHTGLRGWFDGDDARLFPLAPDDRARRMIEGFGGADVVRSKIDTAIADDDLRWAVEMATWLVTAGDATADDRGRLASALRLIAQRSSSANVRNHCLTRALELEGAIDLGRFRRHRFARGAVLAAEPADAIRALRVVLDPDLCPPDEMEVGFDFGSGVDVGLRLRHHVAVPTDGHRADHTVTMSHATLADLLAGRTTLGDALAAGSVRATDDRAVRAALACFEVDSLRS